MIEYTCNFHCANPYRHEDGIPVFEGLKLLTDPALPSAKLSLCYNGQTRDFLMKARDTYTMVLPDSRNPDAAFTDPYLNLILIPEIIRLLAVRHFRTGDRRLRNLSRRNVYALTLNTPFEEAEILSRAPLRAFTGPRIQDDLRICELAVRYLQRLGGSCLHCVLLVENTQGITPFTVDYTVNPLGEEYFASARARVKKELHL